MNEQPPDAIVEPLRRAIYAGIRLALDASPVYVPRALIVQVLADMAAEQSKLAVPSVARKGEGWVASETVCGPQAA